MFSQAHELAQDVERGGEPADRGDEPQRGLGYRVRLTAAIAGDSMSATMDLLTPVIERLRAVRDRDLDDIAARSGVPRPTVAKIKYRQVDDPRVSTIQKLYTHLFETPDQRP